MSQTILQKYNILAKKSLGQNFLIDDQILMHIAQSIPLAGKNVLEVGPGYGALTEKIIDQKPQSLHLVELDSDMVEILEHREAIGDFDLGDIDFQIFQQDILEFMPVFQKYSVIANIPYYITSPILTRFLYDLQDGPEEMLILMQADVADKILSKGKKGAKKSSVLSLMIEKKSHVTEKIFVPKESFSPQPKVESSVVYFQRHEKYSEIDDKKFLEFIKHGFAEPRKKR